MGGSDRENYACNKTRIAQLEARRDRIRTLNDAFRKLRASGYVTLTLGVKALGSAALQQILRMVAEHDSFDARNDPYGEHDFGAIEWNGEKLFWKIDCYDKRLEYGSPDPADPAVTTRVLTIMLASEY